MYEAVGRGGRVERVERCVGGGEKGEVGVRTGMGAEEWNGGIGNAGRWKVEGGRWKVEGGRVESL